MKLNLIAKSECDPVQKQLDVRVELDNGDINISYNGMLVAYIDKTDGSIMVLANGDTEAAKLSAAGVAMADDESNRVMVG